MNMNKVFLVLFMLLIESSEAVKCYECTACDITSNTMTCEGKYCTKTPVEADSGAFYVVYGSIPF